MTRDYSQFFPSLSNKSDRPVERSPLDRLGWHAFFSAQISVDDLEQTPPVRVTEVHRSELRVSGAEADQSIPYIPGAAVGDWLLLNPDLPQSSRILERKSLIKRRAPGTGRAEQLIAANIDTAFIVTSCNADFSIARLERYIALALDAEITPVVLLTKADLCPDPDVFVNAAQAVSAQVSVVALNALEDRVEDVLAPWCAPGQTIAFLGSSGVGKSTLTNALVSGPPSATQAVRESDAKGRHTTTRRQLHIASSGLLVLDTPGMRELQLTDAASGIEDLFADIYDVATRCRFRDCEHLSEPGCAVRAEVDAGTLDPDRLARWRKLAKEEAFNSASLAERRHADKAFGKMVRRAMQDKSGRQGRDR